MTPFQKTPNVGRAKQSHVPASPARPVRPRTSRVSTRAGVLIAAAALAAAIFASAAFGAPVPNPTLLSSTTALHGVTPVGGSSNLALTLTYSASGTPATVTAVTTGVAGMDFSIFDAGTCTPPAAVAAQSTCTLTVAFTPKFPGRRDGAVRIVDGNGVLLAQALVTGRASGALPVLKPGRIDTVAGSYGWTYLTDNVPGTSAYIFTPKSAVIDAAGNLFISDTGNSRIRRVDAQTGTITTFAGTGSPAFAGDGLQARAASISGPAGLVLDGAGNLYFSDYQNSVVRRIDAVTGIINTVAGTPLTPGFSNGINDTATNAQLNLPESLAFDLDGNLLIADSGNNMIRKVDASTGKISTVAGTLAPSYAGEGLTATASPLSDPTGVAVASDGSIYIADTGNQRIRRVGTDRKLYTVAGNGGQSFGGDGSSALQASLNGPANVVLDPAGNVYFTDSGSNRVRMVNAATGNIETITGNDSEAYSGDAGPANLATHYGPYGLFYAQNGDIYLTDMFHMRVRRISASALPLTYPVMRVSKTSTPQSAGLINDGDQPLTLSSPALHESALDAKTTTCFGAAAAPLASASECVLGVQFAPTEVGNPVVGTLGLPSLATNVTPVITLSGQVLSVNPTTVALDVLSPSTNPSMLGDAVTLQAGVTSDDKARKGDVTFTIDGTTVCDAVSLTAAGTANCVIPGLALGSHTVVASYSGDPQNASSVSGPYKQVVKQRTTLLLVSSSLTAVVTKDVKFTLTATAPTGVPTGTVTFLDGATQLDTESLDGNGSASFITSGLSLGTHSITVQYAGDTANAASTSAPVRQVIRQGTTTTSVGSTNASAAVGTQISLGATVSSLDGLNPTGSVSFRSGSTVFGSAPLQADGTATLTLANLPAGSYSVVATYSGDTNDAGSNSQPFAQSSNKLPTTTSLATDATSLTAGAPLHLTTHTVLAPGATAFGTISGVVTFTDNGAPLGTATIGADGNSTFTAINLSVGTHILNATYTGDANHASSIGTYTQAVVQTASIISVTPASSTVLAGKEARFVATVSSNTGIPTGSVSFQDGSTTVGTANLVKGVATFTTTTLPAGQHTLTATYQGDANYLQVTSSPVAIDVVLAQTSLALTGPGSSVVVTTAANFSAALSTEGVAPTGTLTLDEGPTTLATKNVTAAGAFAFNVNTLSVGQHTLTVHYSGDKNNAASASSVVTVQVRTADTATALVSSAASSILGRNVTFTATVTSSVANLTGSVDLFENGNVVGSAPVNNGTAVITLSTLSFGKQTIFARYSGDGQHSTSSSAPVQQAVLQPATVNVASSLNPAISGQLVTLSASVPGAAGLTPTGTIVFSDGGTVLGTTALNAAGQAVVQTSTLAVGTHPIQATYSGDANFAQAQAGLSQLVKISTTHVTLAISVNPAIYGNVTDLTATVQSDGGPATGSVQFTEAGAAVGTAMLNANGVGVLHISTLKPGAHTLTAVYLGDGKAGPSTSPALSFLVKQQTALTLASNANPALTLDHVIFTATLQNSKAAAATGNIVFSDGAKVIGTAPLTAMGTATLDLPPMSSGTHSITAVYAGDDADFPASSSPLSQAVNLRMTQTNLSASSTSLSDAQQVTLIVIVQSPTPSAVAPPTGKVTLYNGVTPIGTVTLDANGTATLTTRLEPDQVGTYSASYAGDASYAGSKSGTTTQKSGLAAQFDLKVSSTDVKVGRAQHIVVNVTAASIKGFSDNLKLGCVGLPYAATCTFTTMTGSVATGMQLPANGSGSMQLTIDTGDPLGGGSSAGGSGTATSSVRTSRNAVLCFIPAGFLLFGLARRKRLLPLLLVVLAGALSIGVTGCGGLQVNSTPAGTYTFQVTAVGQSSGVTESQTVTLTVAQ